MALQQIVLDQYYGGISDPEKQIVRSAYYQEKQYQFGFAQNINVLEDSGQFQLNPKTTLDSGNVFTGLPKWIVSGQPYTSDVFAYDANGHIYKRTGGTWSDIRTVANSHGQGMTVFNDYLYYVQDSQVGRYGPLSGSPGFTDNWQTGLTNTATTGYAPIMPFSLGLVIGHANAVAYWDQVTFTAQKLLFPPGLQVRTISTQDEFGVFGTFSGTDVTKSDIGFMYFWDGVSQTFNNFIKADGGINVMLSNKNRLMSFIGSGGILYLDSSPLKVAQQLPKLLVADSIEIYPGAATNWKGLALFGIGGTVTSSTLIQGVYHWGNRADAYPEGLNMDYTISTGHITSVKFGALAGIGNSLYIGWEDDNGGTTYGIDLVTNTANAFATGYLETTVIDNKLPFDDKLALRLKLAHAPLRSGESIQLAYKINRGNYTTSSANSTVGSTITSFPIVAPARFREFVGKAILNATTTSPTGLAFALIMDDLAEEKNY
jgi:hypothetical protein